MPRYRDMMFRTLFLGLVLLSGPLVAEEPVDLVWPWLDSANSRWFFFNSATRPFGMVNLSPDTETDGAWGSGYRYDTQEVKGLSHVHAWQLSGVSVMPVSSTASIKDLLGDYYSPFSHETEVVRPGYHKLHLDRFGIGVELTATRRVGFHRYRYKDGAPRQVLIPLKGQLGPVEIGKSTVRQTGPREVEGFLVNEPTRRRPKATPLYFVIRFDQDLASLDYREGKGALLHFSPGSEPLLMKVGVSYVDAAGARNNLEVELPHWEFDRVAEEARDSWNDWLGKIRIEGGTREQQVRFYSDLFHALQGRRIISDADGRYSDQTGSEAPGAPIAPGRQGPAPLQSPQFRFLLGRPVDHPDPVAAGLSTRGVRFCPFTDDVLP